MWTNIATPAVGAPTKRSDIAKIIGNLSHLYSLIGSGQSFVPNGSFELDTDDDGVPDGWEFTAANGGNATIDTDIKAHGGKSLKVNSTDANSGGTISMSDFLPVSPGRTLSVSYQAKASDPDGSCTIACLVDWYDSNFQLVSTDTLAGDDGYTYWQMRVVSAACPLTACWAKLRWVLTANQTDRQMWLDDVQLESAPFTRAFDYTCADPGGVIRYGNKLFLFQWNGAGAHTILVQIDTSNGRVSLVRDLNPDQWNIACSLWKMSDGSRRLVWAAGANTKGIYAIDMANPANYYSLVTGAVYMDVNNRVVYVDETGAGGYDHPDFYLVQDGYGAPTLGAIQMVKYYWTGDAYARGIVGTNLNLMSADVQNGLLFRGLEPNAGAKVLSCQYNPVKRRLYVVANSTGHIHIFNLSLADSAHIGNWWVQAEPARCMQLTYEKTIGIRGNGNLYSDVGSERINIEFDLDTGAERAVCFTRRGNANLLGSATVAPWME